MWNIALYFPVLVKGLRSEQYDRYSADDIFKCIFLSKNVDILIQILQKLVYRHPKRRRAFSWTKDDTAYWHIYMNALVNTIWATFDEPLTPSSTHAPRDNQSARR